MIENEPGRFRQIYAKLENDFNSLREDMQKGIYTTGSKTLDVCFLAVCGNFDDVIAEKPWEEYRDCVEYLNVFRKELKLYAKELVLYRGEDGTRCGRIAARPLTIDIPKMTISINTGGTFVEKQGNYWQGRKGDIAALHVNEYDDFEFPNLVLDWTSDSEFLLIGDEAVRERLGGEFNHVSGLLMPISKKQLKLPI